MSSSQDKENSKVAGSKDQLNARRKAVRAIVIGGGAVTSAKSLPSEWKAPIVNSVVLPSHAATTDDSDSSGSGTVPQSTTTVTPTTATPTTTSRPTTTLCPPNQYYQGGECYYYAEM